jgi:hypothetical protein
MTDLFEQRLRDAARSLPTPDAPPSLIERVLAERASGTRSILPVATPRRAFRPMAFRCDRCLRGWRGRRWR